MLGWLPETMLYSPGRPCRVLLPEAVHKTQRPMFWSVKMKLSRGPGAVRAVPQFISHWLFGHFQFKTQLTEILAPAGVFVPRHEDPRIWWQQRIAFCHLTLDILTLALLLDLYQFFWNWNSFVWWIMCRKISWIWVSVFCCVCDVYSGVASSFLKLLSSSKTPTSGFAAFSPVLVGYSS